MSWTPDQEAELLETAGAALDRLTGLVTNLLDLSRLEAGVLSVFPQAVGLDDVVSQALQHVTAPLELDVPADLPLVDADPGLLERVIDNLVQNALRHSSSPVRISASAHAARVELRIADRGRGIPSAERERAFAAFQRGDDKATSGTSGVGLGLAIAKGFVEAMSGELVMEDTPGGGLTMVISLPASA